MSKSLNLFAGATVGVGLMLTAAYNFADRNVTAFPEKSRVLGALPAPIPEPEAPVQVAEAAPASEGILVSAAHADEASAGLRFGLGREALPEEIAAWNVDVSPDGTGLPDGSGDAIDGEPLFEENCAVCHGSFAEGVDNWPKLAGGDGTLADEDPLKTVGSYWPYLSTVFDYVHRSMPFGNAQSLSADETYAIVAYILYSNDMIDDDFVLSRDSWTEVEMGNADGFIIDDRAETEYAQWRTEPCMENCKETVEITMRATVLDVTPDEEGAEEAPAEMDHSPAVATAAPVEEAAAEPAAEAPVAAAAAPAALDAELVAAGEKVFKKCKACHQVGDGAKNKTGPQLNAIVGRAIGGVDGFKYSSAMAEHGGVWDEAALAAFLAKPKDYIKGTKMAFAGLRKDDDITAVIEYLKSTAP
ncbi:c-type cytochrome [Tropicibacter naphthalenivorans]|uniref:Cytochrome c2 n=1 Tax=Tropicibacter naphthalenivorans TaxID=441103 RepID=A0A0P1GRG5_9RHOB|nr:c-type cytochrome [Tropicibacter naphthalenivorans]CUH77812.1 Cytochrome c2 [Tropicibacter naphthalenivorans]SMC95983.1 sulfur dehydrogenase subunit SoxD [Tropicibacter naphthalenivorans]